VFGYILQTFNHDMKNSLSGGCGNILFCNFSIGHKGKRSHDLVVHFPFINQGKTT